MAIQGSWGVMPCQLANKFLQFKGVSCLHLQGLAVQVYLDEKIHIFWNVMQCQLVNNYRCFGDTILLKRNIPNFSLTAIIKISENKMKVKLDATLTGLIKINKRV